MADESRRASGFAVFKGSAGLIVAAAVVTILLVFIPGYRLFLLFSALIGIAIWQGLALWHRSHPIKDDDVENKRPLGL